eukprot:Nk52_evm86s215 gene=Nk52_evmTU86s215
MAEVHLIGEICGASEFEYSGLFCVWGINAGPSWRLLEGLDEGRTQVDNADCGMISSWTHPIDIHYAVKGIQGWPKLHFEVWHQDSHGRNELAGYGFVNVPTSPGTYDLDVATWKPAGSIGEQITSYFVGGGPRLQNKELIYSNNDRYRLRTVAAGKVHVQLGVIVRNFEKHGVEL